MKLEITALGRLALVPVLALTVACSKTEFGLGEESEQFAAGVTYNNKVDIILMVDNSSSMLQYQNKFSSEVPSMIGHLNRLNLDYHIAVVTSDMRSGGNGGRFVGSPRFLSKSTPNLVSTLQSRVTVGQNGSDLERGLESLKTVLQPRYLQGEGAGFFRDDALLAMIVLTNEDDYSADSVNTLKQYFDSIKPPVTNVGKSWILNFIGVVTIDGQCRTTADFKEAGLRYMELADHSGGIKESICESSLGGAVSNVRARIVEILSEYKLPRRPVVDSIQVTINGKTVAKDPVNGWSYSSEANSVRFHGTAQPGATDVIKVNYTPAEGT